ncbi:MAG: FecR domain-containing protein [Planctomycetota bacterium]|jgi:outer membrane lipoprotein-sorting protein
MRPADIEKLIRDVPIDTSTETDTAVLGDTLKAFENSRKTKSAKIEPGIRRITVKNRITKLAVAAIIIIVAIAGIRHFTGSIEGAGVAWAEVAEKVDQIQTYTHRTTQTRPEGVESFESVVYSSSQHGRRIDVYEDGEIVMHSYVLLEAKSAVAIMPSAKKYQRTPLSEEEVEDELHASDPREVVKEFMSMEYKSLGRSRIDGVEVEGIEVENPEITAELYENCVGRLWVDVETELPVRIEIDGVANRGLGRMKLVVDDLEWNAEIGADDFRPNIPDDYTSAARMVAAEVNGPKVHNLDDGSVVKLADGATIRLYESTVKRGFEHIVGEIEVTVAKAAGEFVVVTAFGTVRALGTIFTMDLIDTVPRDSTERIEVLAVKVREGAVEVSNPAGSMIVRENQGVTVEKDKEPYDFRQDENLPERLVERIQAMLDAFEAGDKRAWIANFNIEVLYDLVKGNIEYSDHPDWFSGMDEEDARRIREGFADVNSLEEMVERALPKININEPHKIYVQSVSMDPDGEHATARCVEVRGERRYLVTTPQWTYFDDDWWQTDD